MTSMMFARVGITVVMVAAASPIASLEQASNTTDVSRFLGTWVGDKKANAKAFRDGLIPSEQGLKISAPSDAFVVTSTFRRPPVTAADPWINGTTLSYKLDGSTSPGSLNGVSATTRLSKEGDALVLTVIQTPARAGGAGARPTLPPPPVGNVLQTIAMSVDGDRLKVEWSSDRFTSSLSYDRQKILLQQVAAARVERRK